MFVRFGALIFAIAILGGCALADQFEFSDYKAPFYDGPRADLRLPTPSLKKYRSRIRAAYFGEINFAGQYILSGWGCGTDCGQGVVINTKTGSVYWLPISITDGVDLQGKSAWEFVPDSRLLVMTGRESENSAPGRFYYLIEQEGLVKIGEKPIQPSQPSAQAPIPETTLSTSYLDEMPCDRCSTTQSYFFGTSAYWMNKASPERKTYCRMNVKDIKDMAECLATDNQILTPPIYPVDQNCAEHSGGAYCVKMEQAAYDIVKLMWARLSGEARARCADTAGTVPMWSYTALQSCLQTDYDVKKQFEVTHFKP